MKRTIPYTLPCLNSMAKRNTKHEIRWRRRIRTLSWWAIPTGLCPYPASGKRRKCLKNGKLVNIGEHQLHLLSIKHLKAYEIYDCIKMNLKWSNWSDKHMKMIIVFKYQSPRRLWVSSWCRHWNPLFLRPTIFCPKCGTWNLRWNKSKFQILWNFKMNINFKMWKLKNVDDF